MAGSSAPARSGSTRKRECGMAVKFTEAGKELYKKV